LRPGLESRRAPLVAVEITKDIEQLVGLCNRRVRFHDNTVIVMCAKLFSLGGVHRGGENCS